MPLFAYIDGLAAMGMLAIGHKMDVERLRLRSRVLAIAPTGSSIVERNQPQATTRWGTDNAVVDAWSAQRLGAWWTWRMLLSLLLGIGTSLISYAFGKSSIEVVLTVPLVVLIFPEWGAMKNFKADLKALEARAHDGSQLS
jgi:hypothetical protein